MEKVITSKQDLVDAIAELQTGADATFLLHSADGKFFEFDFDTKKAKKVDTLEPQVNPFYVAEAEAEAESEDLDLSEELDELEIPSEAELKAAAKKAEKQKQKEEAKAEKAAKLAEKKAQIAAKKEADAQKRKEKLAQVKAYLTEHAFDFAKVCVSAVGAVALVGILVVLILAYTSGNII